MKKILIIVSFYSIFARLEFKKSYLKFLLLNPETHFQEIVAQARTVILTGGTMQPVFVLHFL
jgi:Rad3-related DNA helicase